MENFDLQKFSELCKNIPTCKKNMTQRERLAYEDAMEAFNVYESEAYKYLKSTIYVLKDGSYMYLDGGKRNFVSFKQFNDSLGMRIKALNGQMYDLITKLNIDMYSFDVYNEEFEIDHIGKRINMKVPIDFKTKDYVATQEDVNALGEFLKFVKDIVCNGDEAQYRYQIMYVSLIFRQQKTDTVYNLFSLLEGTGKTTYINFLKRIIGKSMDVVTRAQISGTDNFNYNMLGKTVLYLEELAEEKEVKKQFLETLKQLATAKEYAYRNMHTLTDSKINISNIVISSNNRILVGRRTYCPFFNCAKTEDREYFARINEIIADEGNMQYIFNYFVNNGISREEFMKLEIPKTDVLSEEIQEKLPSYYKFIKDEFLFNIPDKRIKTTLMYEKYRDWFTNKYNGDIKYICGKTTLYQCLLELGFRKCCIHGDYYFCFETETREQVMRIYTTKKWVSQEDIDTYRKQHVMFTEEEISDAIDAEDIKKAQFSEIDKIGNLVEDVVKGINHNVNVLYSKKETKKNNKADRIKRLTIHFDALERYM